MKLMCMQGGERIEPSLDDSDQFTDINSISTLRSLLPRVFWFFIFVLNAGVQAFTTGHGTE